MTAAFGASWRRGGARKTTVEPVGSARVTNRSELRRRLGHHASRCGCTDVSLVAHAYRRWGRGLADHVDGRFAVALIDSAGSVVMIRDHLGLGQLIYTIDHDTVHLAHTVDEVLRRTSQRPTIDRDRVIDSLIDPFEAAAPSRTFFHGVHRVPPATVVTIDGSLVVRERRYWTIDDGQIDSAPRIAAQATKLREALGAAIDESCGDGRPTALLLSGGVDSATIAMIAAQRHEIVAISAVSSHDEPGTETYFARKIAHHAQGRSVEVPTSALKCLGTQHTLAMTADGLFDYGMAIPHACYAVAADNGVPRVLDGGFADNILSPLRRRRWLRRWLVRRLRGQDRASTHVTSVAGQLGIRLTAADVERLAERLLDLTGSASNRGALIDHPFVTVGVQRYARVAETHGVEPHHPWLDRRVLGVALALADDHLVDERGDKAVLRCLASQMMPHDIAWRPKGDQLGAEFNAAWAAKAEFRPPVDPNELHREIFLGDRLRRIASTDVETGADHTTRVAYDWISHYGGAQ